MSVARAGIQAKHRLLVVVAVGLLAAVGAVGVLAPDDDHLEAAQAALDDDQAFRGATTAGEALLRVSVELQRAGAACDDDDGDAAACARFFTAAAFARVSSVDVLRCRRPDIFTFRHRFRDYLAALADGHDPDPPSPPNCD